MAEYVESLTGEETTLRHFLEELNGSDVVWDIGAAFGLYTVFASRRVPGGSIFAFEPEPRMRGLLVENLTRNGDSSTRVLSCALGDTDRDTVLYPSDTPNVGASALVHRPDYRLKQRGTPVAMRRGDSLVSLGEASSPTVVKLDVEGAEALVLQGMRTLLLQPSFRTLYCEIHPLLLPLFGSSAEQLETLITKAGFTFVERYTRGREVHVICQRHS